MILDTVACPGCNFAGSPRNLHAHFAGQHKDWVTFDQSGTKWSYTLTCPVCSETYSQPIRAGRAGEGFLESYQEEIRAVATDVLLNHYLGEHVLESEEQDKKNKDVKK